MAEDPFDYAFSVRNRAVRLTNLEKQASGRKLKISYFLNGFHGMADDVMHTLEPALDYDGCAARLCRPAVPGTNTSALALSPLLFLLNQIPHPEEGLSRKCYAMQSKYDKPESATSTTLFGSLQ